jgi:hypothetical protein
VVDEVRGDSDVRLAELGGGLRVSLTLLESTLAGTRRGVGV